MVSSNKKMDLIIPEPIGAREREIIEKLDAFATQLKEYFVEREDVIDCMFIALLSDNHVIMIGPPGTAKSYLIESFNKHVEGFEYFDWQVTKFTTPEELFGPYSLKKLQDDKYERVTGGKLPEADLVYLDEVYNANSSILNSCNSIMNERRFQGKRTKTRCIFGATNFIPEERILVAFHDRFLLRLIIDDIHEADNFERMLQSGEYVPRGTVTADDIDALRAVLVNVDVRPVIPIMSKLRELLRIEHVAPSSRRFKWAIKALKARALLSGRSACTQDDVYVLRHVLWTDPKEIPLVEGVIMKSIDPDMARIKGAFDQAQEVAGNVKLLDPNKDGDFKGIQEGLMKLKQIGEQISSMRTSSMMMPKVALLAEKLENTIKQTHASLVKEKLGNII